MAELQNAGERAVAIRERVESVREWIQRPAMLAELEKALPQNSMAPIRLARIVMNEVQRTPRLAECTSQSFAGALMTCAQMALEPGPAGLCFLIPRRNSRNNNAMEVNWQIGYKGLIQLAHRSPKVAGVHANIVHEGDFFDWEEGTTPFIKHRPADEPSEEWTHGWAAITTVTGGHITKVMPKAAILKVRERYSESWKNQRARAYSPWTTNEEEMALKTVLIRAMKLAPISYELAYAINLDERATNGVAQEIEIDVPDTDDDAIDWDSVEANIADPQEEPEVSQEVEDD